MLGHLIVKHLHLGSLSAFFLIGYKANSKLLQTDVKLKLLFFLFAIPFFIPHVLAEQCHRHPSEVLKPEQEEVTTKITDVINSPRHLISLTVGKSKTVNHENCMTSWG